MRIAGLVGSTWVAAVFLFACGADTVGGRDPGEGALQITVQNVDKVGDVVTIDVTLQPTPSGAPIDVPLVPPVTGNNWNQVVSSVPAGNFALTAVARNAASEIIFVSAAVPVSITHGNTTAVTIFMRQELEDPDVAAPFITSVVFDAPPVASQSVGITVYAGGGLPGALSLDGAPSSDGSFATQPGDARNGARITWHTSSQAGNQTLSLYVKDAGGNVAIVTLVVQVAAQVGAIDFTVNFNHAPVANINFEGESRDTGVKIAIFATYDDVEYDPMDMNLSQIEYSWDFSDCDAVGLKFDSANSDSPGRPLDSPLPLDTVPPDGSTTHTFVLGAEDGTVTYECDVTVHLRDRNSQGRSERIQTLSIQTGAFQTVIP